MGRFLYTNRFTVSEVPSISIFWLNKSKFLKAGIHTGMKSYSSRGKDKGTIVFKVTMTEVNNEYIEIVYLPSSEKKKPLYYKAWITTTSCNFGGNRWWFLCPFVKNGIDCERRVGKLYLLDGVLACRHCHHLTYKSCQESHKYDRIFRGIGIHPKFAENFLQKQPQDATLLEKVGVLFSRDRLFS